MEGILKKNPIVSLLVKSLLVSFILSAVILLLTAVLMLNLNLSSTAISVLVIAAYIISNFLGGLIMGKGMEQKRFLWGMASGAGYFLVLLLLSVLVSGTKDFSLISTIRTLAICVLSGMVGGMLS